MKSKRVQTVDSLLMLVLFVPLTGPFACLFETSGEFLNAEYASGSAESSLYSRLWLIVSALVESTSYFIFGSRGELSNGKNQYWVPCWLTWLFVWFVEQNILVVSVASGSASIVNWSASTIAHLLLASTSDWVQRMRVWWLLSISLLCSWLIVASLAHRFSQKHPGIFSWFFRK